MNGQNTVVPNRFVALIAQVTNAIHDRTINPALADYLDTSFPPRGEWYDEMQSLCRQGCAEGWLCASEHEGTRFGRPLDPGDVTHGFSVDVVEMKNIVGPHHVHPTGEIDLVMPLDEEAELDGVSAGWKVYEAGSAHCPTVTGGKAIIIYLLPEGAIEFTPAGTGI